MWLKLNILLILSSCVFHVNAQKVDSDALINNIKVEITKFFVKQKILETNEINSSLKSVFATELKDQKTLGYNINGIYRIGVFQSHSEQHILIKENSVFKIFDISELNIVLGEVIDYSKKKNLTANTTLFYITAIMGMYDDNHKNTTAGGILRKQKQ